MGNNSHFLAYMENRERNVRSLSAARQLNAIVTEVAKYARIKWKLCVSVRYKVIY
jgi:hypothetical protein